MIVRAATDADHAALWRILEPILRAGETYALPRDWGELEALAYWLAPEHAVFVAEVDGVVQGTYFLRANQKGGGAHVANCGYMSGVHGRGVARAMAEHSKAEARRLGFRAIQFNFVVSTNERAVKLWHALGWLTVGRLPDAFLHPKHGFVDALVMFQTLA